MLAKLLIIVGLVAAGLLLILLTTVPPSASGAMGILAVFLLSYIVLLCFFTFAIWVLAKVVDRVGRGLRLFRNGYSVSLKRSYYYSTVVSLGPIIVVSLQSVGGAGIYEFGLVLVFVLLGCVYVARRAV